MAERDGPPKQDVLEQNNVIWAIPYGRTACMDLKCRLVREAAASLAEDDTTFEIVAETNTGYFLIKVSPESEIENILIKKVALNAVEKTAIFFYPIQTVLHYVSQIISDPISIKQIEDIEKLLDKKIGTQVHNFIIAEVGFTSFIPNFSGDIIEPNHKQREQRRIILKLDFLDGLRLNKRELVAETLWDCWLLWEGKENVTLPMTFTKKRLGKIVFRLMPQCPNCHSDDHWSEECRWRDSYRFLKENLELEAEDADADVDKKMEMEAEMEIET